MRISSAIAGGIGLLAAGSAQASPAAGAGVAISVTVPEVCQFDAPAVLLSVSDTRTTARLFEMCNGASGFRIVASHRPLAGGERVRVDYEGQVSELSPSGISDVAFRYGPFVGHRTVAIETAGLTESIAISFGMTPV